MGNSPQRSRTSGRAAADGALVRSPHGLLGARAGSRWRRTAVRGDSGVARCRQTTSRTRSCLVSWCSASGTCCSRTTESGVRGADSGRNAGQTTRRHPIMGRWPFRARSGPCGCGISTGWSSLMRWRTVRLPDTSGSGTVRRWHDSSATCCPSIRSVLTLPAGGVDAARGGPPEVLVVGIEPFSVEPGVGLSNLWRRRCRGSLDEVAKGRV